MDNIKSLYFLSKRNDTQILKSLPGNSIFNRTTDANMDPCITHLEEVDKLKVIRNKDIEDFLKANSDIYYDNDKDKRPCCDVVYTKINNNFFVKNNEYFEKATEYYFTIYSAIFPYFGLKTITLNLSNTNNNENKVNLDVNFIATKVGISNVSSKENTDSNKISMNFDKDLNDLKIMNNLNNSPENSINIIYNDLFSKTMQKSLYKIGIIDELDLIDKRIKNRMNSFSKIKNLKNTNTHEVRSNLCLSFNLSSTIGLLAGYSNNEHISHSVSYDMTFFNLHKLNQSINVIIPKVKEEDEINFYTSQVPAVNGPWPINCKTIKSINNIKNLDIAREKAFEMIKEDPIHNIVEIVEMFNFDIGKFFFNRQYSVYSVKLFYADEGSEADVHVGKGRRYVAFDSELFCCKDKVIETLKRESFF